MDMDRVPDQWRNPALYAAAGIVAALSAALAIASDRAAENPGVQGMTVLVASTPTVLSVAAVVAGGYWILRDL